MPGPLVGEEAACEAAGRRQRRHSWPPSCVDWGFGGTQQDQHTTTIVVCVRERERGVCVWGRSDGACFALLFPTFGGAVAGEGEGGVAGAGAQGPHLARVRKAPGLAQVVGVLVVLEEEQLGLHVSAFDAFSVGAGDTPRPRPRPCALTRHAHAPRWRRAGWRTPRGSGAAPGRPARPPGTASVP